MLALDPRRGRLPAAVPPRRGRLEHAPGKAQHELVRAPVREVEEGVEVPLHPGAGIALEVPPLVVVREPGGGDDGARRDGTELLHLALGERPVDGQELVVLVLAHGALLTTRAWRLCPAGPSGLVAALEIARPRAQRRAANSSRNSRSAVNIV